MLGRESTLTECFLDGNMTFHKSAAPAIPTDDVCYQFSIHNSIAENVSQQGERTPLAALQM